MNLSDLNAEYDRLQQEYGAKEIIQIFVLCL